MGRWRPPAAKSTKYITLNGYTRLNNELKKLWKEERPKITQSIAEAAAQGDRSDNAEYTEGKRQLREIDRRIRYLAARLEDITVVDRKPEITDIVLFGAWITLIDEEDNTHVFQIVGPDEIDSTGKYLSVDSPLAKAALKKSEQDEITFTKPDGSVKYFILKKIEYRNY